MRIALAGPLSLHSLPAITITYRPLLPPEVGTEGSQKAPKVFLLQPLLLAPYLFIKAGTAWDEGGGGGGWGGDLRGNTRWEDAPSLGHRFIITKCFQVRKVNALELNVCVRGRGGGKLLQSLPSDSVKDPAQRAAPPDTPCAEKLHS